ncbi:hypothetical protein FMUBM48_34320 [Nocardia cyriacigeorgica]|nr:hypothetical protein FMUBM48_34320 [Nocardia cyriacigeorgica]
MDYHPEVRDAMPRWIATWTPNQAITVHQAAKSFEAMGELAAAEQHYRLTCDIWNPATHSRVHALAAAETGLIRWRLGKHEDAASHPAAGHPGAGSHELGADSPPTGQDPCHGTRAACGDRRRAVTCHEALLWMPSCESVSRIKRLSP